MQRRARLDIEFRQAIEKRRRATVRDAIDVAVGFGDIFRIERGEFQGLGLVGRKDALRLLGLSVDGVSRARDGREAETTEPGAGAVAAGSGVGEGARGGGEEVGVVEALEDGGVVVAGEVGEDVGFAGVGA